MESPESYALRICGPKILQNLYVSEVLDQLLAESWLTDSECELINAEKTSNDKCRKLLDYLRRLPPEGIRCFLSALDESKPWLAEYIRSRQKDQSSNSRRHEHNVSDLRETLINGAVPDNPSRFVHRPALTESLSGCLRDLASRFRVQSAPPKCANDLSDIMAAVDIGQSPVAPSISNHPPPTNAWLLVHGPPGCGKTVLCTSTLREHASAVIECFPGGVVWMRVGPLMDLATNSSPSEVHVQSADAREKQLISFIDRLERRLAHLTRRTTTDYNATGGATHIIHNINPQASSLDDSSERLRRTLIRRQKRSSWGPTENDSLSTSLLLIVLDDVWDVEVGQVLSSMPAAFMVTSRDQSVLSLVAGKVDQFDLHEDMTDAEAAQLLSAWSNLPISTLLAEKSQSEADNVLHHLVPLCRGSPFAVNVVGHLLLTQPHHVGDYLCNPKGTEPEFIDWVALSWPSSYGYDSVFLTLNHTITRLPGGAQAYFEQLVIFDADVVLNHKMLAILWNVTFDLAEALLKLFVRFSLAVKCWSSYSEGYGFHLYPLQLDVLRGSVEPIKQTQYHAKFIENYSLFCAGRWWQLASSDEHTYFWHHATDHLFQGGKFNQLADLLTNLEFLRGRLAVIGASLVIADFRRYQAVFATLHRIDEWHAYVRFVQTNAYFLIDPGSLQPADRSRSPYRKRLRAGSFWSLDSSSGASAFTQPSSPWRTDSPGPKPASSRPVTATQTNRPKGIDLIQLGLGLPHDSPVFRQSVELLLKQHQVRSHSHANLKRGVAANTLSEYYWFWCNSHVAASQLVWAIPTGPQAVTCLAVESENCPDLRITSGAPETTAPNVKVTPGRFRKRYLAGTCDGRVLLLDANSGYEVAVQQIYPGKVEIKLLTFVSNNTECLTCGSDGALVLSTLPVSELLEPLPNSHDIEVNIESGSGSSDRARSPNNYQYDHMGGLDVDDEDDAVLTIPHSAAMGRRGSLLISDDTDDELNDTLVDDLKLSVSAWRRRSSAASPAINPPGLSVPAPIVLAELPRLSELARVDRSSNASDQHASQPGDKKVSFELHSISVSPKLDIVLLSGEGELNVEILHTDGPEDPEPVQPSILLPSVYYLKRNGNRFFLDQSRSLRLPAFSPWFESMTSKNQLSVVCTNISAVSDDSQYVAVGLSNGLVWLYNLEEVSWVSCIPTYVANMWNKLMEDSSGGCDSHTEKLIRERVLTGLEVGTVPSACLFVPTYNTDEDDLADNAQINHMFAAAIGSSVLVWPVPQTVPFDDSKLTEQDQIVSHSRPALCLRCALTCSVLTLDACLIADQRVLAGGTTNGRVLFWRIRDGCLLLDLSAHSSWVTAVRLLPPDINGSDDDYVNSNSLPVGLLTASSDGVIKRWEVGAACLPSPSTPIPTGMTSLSDTQLRRFSLQSMISSRSNDRSNAVHGLWTDVFDVWFGPSASLLVVGRRRHSSDLQFLFRPQEGIYDGLGRHDTAFTFQEIAIKPSQPFYWKQTDCPTVHLSPRKMSEQSQASSSKKVTPSSPGPVSVNRKISRHTMPATRHWIATTGLSGTIHGRATAVSFWPSGNWVAVGFSIGIVQVFSLHFDESSLFGIVKRFCLVTESAGAVPALKSSHSKVLDRVVHLHTWQSNNANEEKFPCQTLVALAVFASGTVRYWHMPSVSHDVSGTSSGYQEVQPTETWPPMHDIGTMHQSRQQRAARKTSTSELQSKVLCDNDELDSVVPVTWSTLRSIQKSSDPSACTSYTPLNSARFNGTGDTKLRTILIWLTTGYDGMVYGRQLMFPNTKLSATPEDQVVQDSVSQTSPANLGPTPWRLDLAAHAPAPIADADVDPTGQWLLTGSTDETAKVWCLSSGSLAFDTGIHGACVRSVCFRPVLDEPYSAAGHEWFIATGDDTGALRIWILPSKRLRKVKTTSMQLGQLNRSLSPDHLLYRRPNTMARSEWHSSSSRHLNRLPSPDMQELERSGSRDARAAFFSNAAGFGGSWLRRLVWSPDGRLITGLSDRLCVWPFEAPNPRLAPSVPTRDRLGGDLLGPRLELKRCHVLRVLSSGFAERSTSALRMLSVGPRRQCCRPAGAETAVDPVLTDLPPTIVTVDVNTGTLYVFDPIGALFQSELQD